MSLHLVFSTVGWRACDARRAPGDAIVLLGDGVYTARTELDTQVQVLAEDAQVRGISIDASHTLIDYAEFVTLCTVHQPIVSWKD